MLHNAETSSFRAVLGKRYATTLLVMSENVTWKYSGLSSCSTSPSVWLHLNNTGAIVAGWRDLVKYYCSIELCHARGHAKSFKNESECWLGFGLGRFGLDKSDEIGTNNQLQSILFLHDCFFCAEGGREEKADLGKSERLCGGRKRREGNNSSPQSCTLWYLCEQKFAWNTN